MQLIWKLGLTTAYRLARIYWFMRRPTTKGAYLAIWVGEHLLIIRNSYKAGATLPAGGVKSNETAAEAAAREAREEVGVEIDPRQLRPTKEFYSDSEFKHDYSIVFEIDLPERPEIHIDRREVESAEFVHSADVNQLVLSPIARQYMSWRQLKANTQAECNEEV